MHCSSQTWTTHHIFVDSLYLSTFFGENQVFLSVDKYSKKRMSWNDVHDKMMHLIQRASFKSLEKQYYCKFITECFELHQDFLYNEIEKFLTQRHYLIVWVVGFCFQVELCALNISRKLTAQDTEEAISGEQELWPCVKKMTVKGHFNIIN